MAEPGDFGALVRSVRDAVAHLRTWRRGERRAPHKPLLLLYALARVQRGESRLVEFDEAEPILSSLLRRFGPGRGPTHPLYPFWYLRNDGLWDVPRADGLPRRGGTKEPLVRAVRESRIEGGFPAPIHDLLRRRPRLVVELAREILDEHFAESLHEDVAEAAGVDLTEATSGAATRRIPRPPGFRDEVLRAYGYRCAICGFQALLDGTTIGVEAAHVRWHAYDGPSTLDNGLALCVLHHKFLDLGVVGLSPQRTVIVTSRISADEETSRLVMRDISRPLRGPQSALAPIDERFAAWHRREVFKSPARAGS